jgi:hypothetical protein
VNDLSTSMRRARERERGRGKEWKREAVVETGSEQRPKIAIKDFFMKERARNDRFKRSQIIQFVVKRDRDFGCDGKRWTKSALTATTNNLDGQK